MAVRTGRKPYSQYVGVPCWLCGAQMRPRKSSLAKHPGTVEHRGGGLCAPCYGKERYRRQNEGLVEEVREELEHAFNLGYDAQRVKQDRALREMCVDYTLKKLGYI